ncbi:pyruvate kinase [Candidatus Kaiserbacteria bacterium]|nr:pyruvate kinase [Candidatus Kaiserbacteria bacterium]
MDTKKKTKIVATIGPASSSSDTLVRLIKSGMNVARVNFSHGDHTEHQSKIHTIRSAARRVGAPVALLADLAGPKIRTGDFKTGHVTLKKGKRVVLTTAKCLGTAERMYVNYPKFADEVKKGNHILLDDGKVRLEVVAVSGADVTCMVRIGGTIASRRGVNVPGAYLSIPSLTAKDKKDLDFIAQNNFAYVALSFVRRAQDIERLRRELEARKSRAHIVAKIETLEAVENLPAIVEATDAVMVARGDLAIEVNHEDVPLLQKRITRMCNASGKPVIIATQMLESMITAAVPTRAEVSDVANAIYDGADAVMLSGETALGEYPVEAVEYMTRVAQKIENECTHKNLGAVLQPRSESIDIYHTVDAVSTSVVKIAEMVDAKAIIALTESGFTARMVSRWRPEQPVLVMTHDDTVVLQSALLFGCRPEKIRKFTHLYQVVDTVKKTVRDLKLAKKDDKVVIAAGIPFGKVGGTNMVHVLKL